VAVAVPAEITLASADEALGALRAALAAAPGGLELDLAPLARFDSAAVAVLVALRREAGVPIALRNVPPNLRKLASLYGVESALFGAAG
jgi:phospholipid transport system transporter-binding protein